MCKAVLRQTDVSSDVGDLAVGATFRVCLRHVCVVLYAGAAVLAARRELLW